MLLVSAHCCAFAAFILPSRPTSVQILPPPCDVGLEVVGEEQNSSEFSLFSKICKENTKTSCDESLTYFNLQNFLFSFWSSSGCFYAHRAPPVTGVVRWFWHHIMCRNLCCTSASWKHKCTIMLLFFHSFNDVPVQKLRDIFLFLYQDFCCLGGNTCRSGEYWVIIRLPQIHVVTCAITPF